ncbi:succinate dehydrogenase subunit C [Salana multivorans]|uniref:Succinate dehydrogenase subunit C n=1 Tax=Salana multivorans TaxID=120377 RepID=A0A3N2DCG6_9MICO|nr:succinate dehydrogenase, cytochrome b556 subunit [Salana multivorans]MBN8882282.1 succinate dehydrogenase, cytochrome b556 subunit [Salana multivorans]ROR97476.1 succinate dehydrogenase subunit C [Salana multivorans]
MASAPTLPPPTPRAQTKEKKFATLYRGGEGMWSWVLQRVTGMLLFLFLLVHVLDTALVRVSPEVYNEVIGTYKTPIMGIGELGLVAAILFHAFNGVRIILVDFLAKGPRYQRVMFWIVIGVAVVLFLGFAPRHLMNVFGGH